MAHPPPPLSMTAGKGIVPSILVILIVALAAAGYLAWKWYAPRDARLSEAPPRQASQAAIEQLPSTLGLMAAISHEAIARAVEDAEVAEATGGDVVERCAESRVGILTASLCLKAEYTYTAARSGEVTVSKHGDGIRVAIPVAVTGYTGLSGKLARRMGLSGRELNAEVLALVDLTYGVDRDWCPTVEAELGYEWIEPATINVTGVMSLDITQRIEPKLDERLAVIEQEMQDSFTCGDFHDTLKDIWAKRSFPLSIPPAGESGDEPAAAVRDELAAKTLYGWLDPQTLAFSGVVSEEDHLGFAFVLTGLTGIGFEPLPTESRELPPFAETPYERGVISLELPVRVPYAELDSALEGALVGRAFTRETQAGPVTVTPASFEVYPSNGRLAVGMGFTADGPGSAGDAEGTVYLSGTPVVDPSGTGIALDDPTFARILDNELWSVLSAVFEEDILAAVSDRTHVDMAGRVGTAVERIMEGAADPERTLSIVLDLEPPAFSISRIVPDESDLVAIVTVDTSLEASLPPELLVPRIMERRERMQQD